MQTIGSILAVVIVLLVGALTFAMRRTTGERRERIGTVGTIGIIVVAAMLTVTLGLPWWLAGILAAVSVAMCIAPRRAR